MNKELQFLVYTTPNEDIKVNAVVKDETIWLTQKALSFLVSIFQQFQNILLIFLKKRNYLNLQLFPKWK